MKAETESRIFSVDEYVRPSNGEPIRSVVLETNDSVIVVWHAHPGQEIAAHVHPHGQDTWTVISGEAEYYQGDGVATHIKAGDIAIAKPGQVHGAMNGSVAKIVKLEHAWRRLDGRNDDGFQVAPFPG
ncbi:TPA: cupin domain-containing protein [Pseudomonas aeruginosa]|nr:cupin domain-containing protein [Pseudomonas aeruginosa]HBP6062557.1 cupin domain-containing protein [Pseudomonas aeruginosa]